MYVCLCTYVCVYFAELCSREYYPKSHAVNHALTVFATPKTGVDWSLGFPGGASGKEPACQCRSWWEMWVQFLASEDSLVEGMATHSSILAWKTPWTEEPGRLQSIGTHKVRHGWSNLAWSTHGLQSTRLLCPWNSPGKSGLHFLLQGIFPLQVLNPCLLHCQVGSTTEPPVVLKFESASAAPGGLPSPLPASSLVGFHWGQRMCVLNNFPGDMRPLVLGPYCIYYEVLPINISFCLKNLCCSRSQ